MPAGANTRKKANIKLTITQATRLLDAEVHELRGKITGFDPTWAGRSHGQGLNQRGDKARAIGPGRYGMGVISSGISSCIRANTSITCPQVLWIHVDVFVSISIHIRIDIGSSRSHE